MHRYLKMLGLILFIIINNLAFAAEGDGGRPGKLLRWAAGGRSIGMGASHIALVEGAYSVYWNTSRLTAGNYSDVGFMHTSLFVDTYVDYIGYSAPLSEFGLKKEYGYAGIGIIHLGSGGFIGKDPNNQETGEYSIGETAFKIGYAYKMSELDFYTLLEANRAGEEFRDISAYILNSMSLGLDIVYFYQFVEDYSGGGAGLGLSLYSEHDIREEDKFTFAYTLSNIAGPSVTLDEKADEFPLTNKIGFAYKWVNDDVEWNEYLRDAKVETDLIFVDKKDFNMNLGFEFKHWQGIYTRFGINEIDWDIGFGIDFHEIEHLNQMDIVHNIKFDFAYRFFRNSEFASLDQSNPLVFSMNYTFAPKVVVEVVEEVEFDRYNEILQKIEEFERQIEDLENQFDDLEKEYESGRGR